MLEAGNDLMIKLLLAKRLKNEVPRRKRDRGAQEEDRLWFVVGKNPEEGPLGEEVWEEELVGVDYDVSGLSEGRHGRRQRMLRSTS
jgi:hypothetical protein